MVMQIPAACPSCGSAEIRAFVPEFYNGGHPVAAEGGLFCPECLSLFPAAAESSPQAEAPPPTPRPIPELTLGGYATAEVKPAAMRPPSKLWSVMRAFCRGELRIKVRIRRPRRRRTLVLANTTLQPRLRT